MATKRDYYEVLGVNKDADEDAINFLMDDPWRLLPEVHDHELQLTLTPPRRCCAVFGSRLNQVHRYMVGESSDSSPPMVESCRLPSREMVCTRTWWSSPEECACWPCWTWRIHDAVGP